MGFYFSQLQKHTVELPNDGAKISIRLTTCAENICPSEGIQAFHLLAANEFLSVLQGYLKVSVASVYLNSKRVQ